ncbi:MAG: aldo/keto reductase [Lautropia sp.]
MTDEVLGELATRRLGASALRVGEIGFGSAPIGNFRFDVSDDDAHAAMQAFWDGGGRYVDTSPFYGYGRSELRVGRFLQGVPRDAYLLSTKVGRWMRPLRPGDDVSGLRKGGLPFMPTFDPSYDGTMRALEQSYLRLGLDRIDIVLIHDVDAFTHGSDAAAEPLFERAMQGAYRALQELRRSGQIAAIGAGINETRWCRRFVEAGDFDCMMLAGRYTLLEHDAETLELMRLCEARGVGLLMAGVFNSGILAAGAGDPSAAFHYRPPPPEVVARVAALEALAAKHGVSLAAAAVQFVLAGDAVASAVLGATHRDEVAANLRGHRTPVPRAFWDDLRAEGRIGAAVPLPGDARGGPAGATGHSS